MLPAAVGLPVCLDSAILSYQTPKPAAVAAELLNLVLLYYHNVNPTEIYSRLHGRPASRQPAGRPDCSTDWTLRAVFVHNRWTLRGSEPGFGFLSEFWV
eukprot:SAG25_NODE_759_length_5531_cov_2.460052_5_plen_99_part_00